MIMRSAGDTARGDEYAQLLLCVTHPSLVLPSTGNLPERSSPRSLCMPCLVCRGHTSPPLPWLCAACFLAKNLAGEPFADMVIMLSSRDDNRAQWPTETIFTKVSKDGLTDCSLSALLTQQLLASCTHFDDSMLLLCMSR